MEKTISIDVTLQDSQIAELRKLTMDEEISDTKLLSGVATWLLQGLSDGGKMIEPQLAVRMRTILGSFSNPSEIIPHLEKSTRRANGRREYTWSPDPTYEQSLRERAQWQGRTVDQLFQDVVNAAMENGWVYVIDPPPRHIKMSEEDLKVIAEILEVEADQLTGTEIADFIKSFAELPLKSE